MSAQLFPRDQPIDAFRLGLHDIMLSGWYNSQTGELAPGFPITAEDTVVDVGCGDGGITSFSARQGAHIILADHDPDKIRQALERLRDSPARLLEAHITDSSPLPLADASCSRVICTEVLEHVDNPKGLMSELFRVGEPGALFLISVPGGEQENLQKSLAPPMYFEKPNHIRIFDAEEFELLVESSGLIIERRLSVSFFWSIWWLFFWQANIPLGQGSHPALDAWARTWVEMLQGRDGMRIKAALDQNMPKVRAVVARKPS